jgi:hypothetical protein
MEALRTNPRVRDVGATRVEGSVATALTQKLQQELKRSIPERRTSWTGMLGRAMGDDQHIKLMNSYFHYAYAGNFVGLQAQHRTPQADEYTDPVYVIMARKEGEEA